MRRSLFIGFVALAALISAWLFARSRTVRPDVPFVQAARGTLVSTVNTNGKVEPEEWVEVRAERAGTVSRVAVMLGEQVATGRTLIEIDAGDSRLELAAARARFEHAGAELQAAEAGGATRVLAEIDQQLATARLQAETDRREYESLARLAEKSAATQDEVNRARDRWQQAEALILSLETRRRAQVSGEDLRSARAKVEEARAAVAQGQRAVAAATVRAPTAGWIFELPVVQGAYLNPGDAIARLGDTRKLRVALYVDEPDLGGIQAGNPVRITWDGMAGKVWEAQVGRLPARIVALGARQVGEVLCRIDNPLRDLPPGANVNAEIRTQVIEEALLVPKAALRTRDGNTGLFVLDGERVAWREIRTGASNITHTQILSGLRAGDSVALPAGLELRDGQLVAPAHSKTE